MYTELYCLREISMKLLSESTCLENIARYFRTI